jgi:ABC-2 type transport system ATP-binding protein
VSDEVVRFRGVTKRFGEFVAVGDLDFTVKKGVVFGVLGPNGAGKTTALRMLNDILLPDRGTIELFGGTPPGRAAGARIGYLPEERGLYPKMRVGELLVFFAELRGLHRKAAVRRAEALLGRLAIADWAKNRVQDLSKGMQQKVQFAAALIHEPELLILDEPWSGLDPINADVLRDVVREQKAAGKTILFSTHLMEQAEKICDDIVIIARGRKVLDGELAAVKRAAHDDRTVAIRFLDAEAHGRAAAALDDASMISGRRSTADQVIVELTEPAAAARLLAALVAAGAGLRRFEVVEPSLHDIFVHRVGGDGSSTAVEGRRADG